MRVYISGPMSGLPDFNRPAFNAMAYTVRAMGFPVLNPAELEAPPCGTWAGWMRKALRDLLWADAVIVLEGWRASRGARLEVLIAEYLGIPVFYSVEQFRAAILQGNAKEQTP